MTGLQSEDLDALFGTARTPTAAQVEDWESKATPQSRMVVTPTVDRRLSDVLSNLPSGPELLRYALRSAPILWVVDQSGTLRVAFEEYVDALTGEPYGIRQKDFDAVAELKVGRRLTRLGHPALLGGRPGRIGGELKWVDDKVVEIGGEPYTGWTVSNASGRFGFHPDRTPETLDNVVSLLAGLGISALPLYIVPRR